MHRVSAIIAALVSLAALALGQGITSVSIASVSGCAAVVSTTEICSTCMTLDCIVEATITAGCDGCAPTPPTIYRSFPCDQGCSNLGGCKTTYQVVTASDSVCESASPATTSPSLPTSTAGTGSTSDAAVGTGDASPTPTQDGGGGIDGTNTGPPATSVNTAGAARLMPLRLW